MKNTKPNRDITAENLCDECGLPISICNIASFAGSYEAGDDKKLRGRLMDENRKEIKDFIAQALTKQKEEIVKQAMQIVSNTLSQAEMLYELQKLDNLNPSKSMGLK